MIATLPIEMMYVLLCLAMALSVYAVWQHSNRVYGNIVFGGFSASVLWFYLAANVITGNIFFDYTDQTDTMVDIPFFWVFVLFGVIMTGYTLVLSFEAVKERHITEADEI